MPQSIKYNGVRYDHKYECQCLPEPMFSREVDLSYQMFPKRTKQQLKCGRCGNDITKETLLRVLKRRGLNV